MNKLFSLTVIWLVCLLVLVACGAPQGGAQSEPLATVLPLATAVANNPSVPVANSAGSNTIELPTVIRPHEAVDITHLPLGDGHISTQPQVGYVWSCQTNFNSNAGGAFVDGPWFNGDGTYNLTAKVSVDGAVAWPSVFTLALNGNSRTITGNDLPNHPTGQYPVARSDDAYQYDPNPNTIAAQTVQINLPANPQMAAQSHCVPGGPIGVLLSGGYFFNALDGPGRDAVAHEVQDDCQGHPERTGAYHYHNLTNCMDDPGTGHSNLLGYAFDGFGIYGHRGENGQDLTNADLDACHGHTHAISWDGQTVTMYHYHATWEYPYTVGCYRGTSAVAGPQGGGPQGGGPQGGGPAGQSGGTGLPGGQGGAPQGGDHVGGMVTAVHGTTISLQNPQHQETVITNSQTQFQVNGQAGSVANVVSGKFVEVTGTRQTDGTFLASLVAVSDQPPGGPGGPGGQGGPPPGGQP